MKTLLICITLCGAAISATSKEVRPGVFRTPDERFENLKDYPFEPHYLIAGKWHHIAVSTPKKHCRLSELQFYVDGKSVGP